VYNYFGCNILQSIVPHCSEFLVLTHIIHRVIVYVKKDVKLTSFWNILAHTDHCSLCMKCHHVSVKCD